MYSQKEYFLNLRESIKLNRKSMNLSQVELAKYVGLSQATIAQIESGRKIPSLQTLFKLSNAFKVSPASFFLD